MRLICPTLILLASLALPLTPSHAQSLGNVVKKSAERETKRQAERRTREAVQCVTGARDCLPDQNPTESGNQPKLDSANGPTPPPAQSSGVLDPFAAQTGASPATSVTAAPFSVPPISGANMVEHQAGKLSTYRRITGFKPKLISYQDHTGMLTRTRYEMTGGQTAPSLIAAWREPLLRQGFTIEWQCSRKAQCGSSSYHQLGAGYMPVNGINLGIAGDVEYMTARRALAGQPTIYVSIALNRKVAYVDVLELAP